MNRLVILKIPSAEVEQGDKAATRAMLPVAIKFLSDGKPGDGFYIFSWLSCAIIFAILSVLALAKGENDDR